jgi:hypothetical protein
VRLLLILPLSFTVRTLVVGQLLPTAAPFPVMHAATAAADASKLSVSTVNVAANKLVWDPTSKLIYLSIPAFAGAPGPAGNAIQALDPLTGQFGLNVALTIQPYSLSISATAKYLYLGSVGSVQQYSLPSLAQDLVTPLGTDEFGRPLFAGSVEASPVDDRTVAVVTDFPLTTPPIGGVFVYDDGVPRAGSICRTVVNGCSFSSDGFLSVQWNQDASRVFWGDELYFSTAPVTPSGIGMARTHLPFLYMEFAHRSSVHHDRVEWRCKSGGGKGDSAGKIATAASKDGAWVYTELCRGAQMEIPVKYVCKKGAVMPNPFSLSRVVRFIQDGHAQITNFPDSDPSGTSDLEIRLKHFTEIENFTFLAYVLAHELAGPARGFSVALANLEVPDPEFQAFVNTLTAPGLVVTDEQLGDTILDVGINWEHFVATFNNILIPGNPLRVSDTIIQEKIDSLDLISEALVREVNFRSANPVPSEH